MPPTLRLTRLTALFLAAGCASAFAQAGTNPRPAVAGLDDSLHSPPPTISIAPTLPTPPPVELRASGELTQAPSRTPMLASTAPTSTAVTIPASTPTPPATAPVVASQLDARFPRYQQLEPAVAFWSNVFGRYSEHQSALHFRDYPHKVFAVLDFRADAQRMDKFQLAKLKQREEDAAKTRVDQLLRQVHAKQHAPETMTFEERRLYDLFADVRGADRFKDQIGTIRAQRGLQERTLTALQTADRYLPTMERIFAGYQLPPQLTRLPIVESSFNVEAYSKSHAAGMWQFIPSSARIYMRLDDVVDDRRDPWTSTDAAARHLRDDYALLQDWPLALTAYNHGRNGISRALQATNGRTLIDLIERNTHPRWGFAGKNYYAEFIAALDVEHDYRTRTQPRRGGLIDFEVVETKHYVPYETLRRLCGADDELFRKLNPAYRPEVIEGKLYVPPGHLIRVPAGRAEAFSVAYSKLGGHERFDAQRALFLLHKVQKGEVLGRIATKYRVSQQAILKANDLRSANTLRVGQVLKIPPHKEYRPGPISVAVGESKPAQTRSQKIAEARASTPKKAASSGGKRGFKVHQVRAGQTLHSIARQYKVSVDDLRSANNLGNSSYIRAGQKLKVPVWSS
ncbi:MAG TPA: LysM peptidoglycan-binding domain-containing protein [Solimonas sp.]